MPEKNNTERHPTLTPILKHKSLRTFIVEHCFRRPFVLHINDKVITQAFTVVDEVNCEGKEHISLTAM